MALSDAQFKAWLKSPGAIRTVLVEVVARIASTETTLYLSSRNYATGGADTPAHTAYQACITGGVSTRESLNLDGSPSMSWGDIQIGNLDGSRDGWLDYVWSNRAVAVYVGDPTWPRADFRLVFSGVVDDIDSQARDTLTLRLRDKLERLNVPVSETVLSGSTENKDRLIPITLGEVHNIEPLLINPTALTYQYHDGLTTAESLIEVRDNGARITAYTTNLNAGTFTLTASPVGQITCDVQGAKPGGTYRNDVGNLVQHLVQSYGPSATRFSGADLDASQLAAFVTACPQAVGRHLGERENVLAVCQELAASVGAQVVCTSTGLLRLIRLALPATGTPTAVTAADMVSLGISQRPAVRATAKLGYARNFTPQTNGLSTGLPASSASALGQEWLSVTSTDATVASTYKLDAQPVQVDTLLIDTTEATTEAQRRRDLWKTQRSVYTATYLPDLLLVELGDTWTITHPRLGLSAGKTGLVVNIERDWLKGRVTVGVLA